MYYLATVTVGTSSATRLYRYVTPKYSSKWETSISSALDSVVTNTFTSKHASPSSDLILVESETPITWEFLLINYPELLL